MICALQQHRRYRDTLAALPAIGMLRESRWSRSQSGPDSFFDPEWLPITRMHPVPIRSLHRPAPLGVRLWLSTMFEQPVEIVGYSDFAHLLLLDARSRQLLWFHPQRRVSQALGSAESLESAICAVAANFDRLIWPLTRSTLEAVRKRLGLLPDQCVYTQTIDHVDPRDFTAYRVVGLWEAMVRQARKSCDRKEAPDDRIAARSAERQRHEATLPVA